MLQSLNTLSLAFGHLTRLLSHGIFFIFIAVVAVLSYVLLVSATFEYSYGQDDLALADLIVLALLALATWRYFHRGKQSQTTLWPLLKRFAFTLTFITLVLLSVVGVFASIALVEPELANEHLTGGADDLLLYGIVGTFIIAIYGATPLPPLSFQTPVPSKQFSGRQDDRHAGNSCSEPEPPTLDPSAEKQV